MVKRLTVAIGRFFKLTTYKGGGNEPNGAGWLYLIMMAIAVMMVWMAYELAGIPPAKMIDILLEGWLNHNIP
jgi:hypothetical protein